MAIMTGPRKGSPGKQPDNYNYSGVPGPRYPPLSRRRTTKNCCRDNFHPINESTIHGCLTSSRSTCLLQGFVLPPPNIPRLPLLRKLLHSPPPSLFLTRLVSFENFALNFPRIIHVSLVIDTLEEGEEIIEDKFEIRDTIRIEVNFRE